jgi:outer membrane protein
VKQALAGAVLLLMAVVAVAQERGSTPAAAEPAAPSASTPPAPRDEVALQASRDYLVGASIGSSANPLGTAEQKLSFGGIWAFQLGRFRFASSGASALLNQGRDTVDSGVSTQLARSDKVSLNTSLAIDDGRDWRDEKDPRFHGLGKVRATVRGRLTLGLTLSERWSLTSRASQDLLGRAGGLRLDTGLNYRHRLSRDTHWDLSFGAGWANGTFRQTHYGVSTEGAAATGLPAYALGSGWDNLSMGWRITSALNRHWVGYAGLGMAQLQGAARRSPLATRPTTYGAGVGLA